MNRRRALLALLPAATFYLVCFAAPEISFLRVSFNRSTGLAEIGRGFTTANYTTALTQRYYLRSITTTAEMCLIVAAISVLIAYPLAHAVVRSRRLGRLVFLVVIVSMFGSTVVAALGWEVLLGPTGVINRALMDMGVTDPLHIVNNFTGAVIGLVQAMVPILVIGIMPICEAVPPSLTSAAYGLGASRWYTFWRVTFPMTGTGLIPFFFVAFASSAGAFTTVAILGGGRVGVLAILIQQEATELLNYPLAATLAAVLLVAVLILVTIGVRVSSYRRRRNDPSVTVMPTEDAEILAVQTRPSR